VCEIDRLRKKERKKMTYFAQIVDHWDCEIDFLGPFHTESDAHNAALEKWDGDETFYAVYIVRRLPASAC